MLFLLPKVTRKWICSYIFKTFLHKTPVLCCRVGSECSAADAWPASVPVLRSLGLETPGGEDTYQGPASFPISHRVSLLPVIILVNYREMLQFRYRFDEKLVFFSKNLLGIPIRSHKVRWGHIRSGKVTKGQTRSEEVRGGQRRSEEVRKGQTMSAEVRQGQ